MSDTTKVWLITGSARGLGRRIAEAVLDGGHRLVATARDPERLADLAARHGDRLRVAPLDVTDADAAERAVRLAVEAFGRLDVLVNNAGYGHLAPFEQMPADSFRAQVETNLFGVVHLTRAALPVMRGQRSGLVVNVSSVGGRVTSPGLSAYQAAKWAVSGFTEVLAQEVAPFGVRAIALEPGGMRTDWAAIAGSQVPELLPEYVPSVGAGRDMIAAYGGHEPGDLTRIARLVLRLADHDALPPHLVLGSDAAQFFEATDGARQRDAEAWRAVTLSTDADAADPTPPLPAAAASRAAVDWQAALRS